MTEQKQTKIVIDDVEYTEDQLNDTAKDAINHIAYLDRKIDQGKFALDGQMVERSAYVAILRQAVSEEAQQVEAAE
jgi:uncharacterized protein YciI